MRFRWRLRGLSLLLLLLFSATGRGQEALNYRASGEQGLYRLSLSPELAVVPVGQYHNWVLTVTDWQSKPVEQAWIAVDGGMAAHGHGLPSKPQVTRYLGEGRYLIEGLLFNMDGEWSLLFAIQAGPGRDRARIDFEVSY